MGMRTDGIGSATGLLVGSIFLLCFYLRMATRSYSEASPRQTTRGLGFCWRFMMCCTGAHGNLLQVSQWWIHMVAMKQGAFPIASILTSLVFQREQPIRVDWVQPVMRPFCCFDCWVFLYTSLQFAIFPELSRTGIGIQTRAWIDGVFFS